VTDPRPALWGLARLISDLRAIARGRILPRTYNRFLGRLVGRLMRRWWA
jgi:hypothetical protein